MKISILSLFPNMFDGFLTESIIKRAINDRKVEIEIINFRDYSPLNNKMVDDTPYGGGSGMVLMCQPIFDAVAVSKIKKLCTHYEYTVLCNCSVISPLNYQHWSNCNIPC